MSIGLVYLELLLSSLYLQLLPAWRFWHVNGTSTSNTTQATKNKTKPPLKGQPQLQNLFTLCGNSLSHSMSNMQTARSSRSAMSWATTSWLASESSSGSSVVHAGVVARLLPENEKSSPGSWEHQLFETIYSKGTEAQNRQNEYTSQSLPEWEFTVWSLLEPVNLGSLPSLQKAWLHRVLLASVWRAHQRQQNVGPASLFTANHVAVKAGHVRLFILYIVARDHGKCGSLHFESFWPGHSSALALSAPGPVGEFEGLRNQLLSQKNFWKNKFAQMHPLFMWTYQVIGAALRRSSVLLLWTDASKL